VRRSAVLSPACERLIDELRRVCRESFDADHLPVHNKATYIGRRATIAASSPLLE